MLLSGSLDFWLFLLGLLRLDVIVNLVDESDGDSHVFPLVLGHILK